MSKIVICCEWSFPIVTRSLLRCVAISCSRNISKASKSRRSNSTLGKPAAVWRVCFEWFSTADNNCKRKYASEKQTKQENGLSECCRLKDLPGHNKISLTEGRVTRLKRNPKKDRHYICREKRIKTETCHTDELMKFQNAHPKFKTRAAAKEFWEFWHLVQDGVKHTICNSSRLKLL